MGGKLRGGFAACGGARIRALAYTVDFATALPDAACGGVHIRALAYTVDFATALRGCGPPRASGFVGMRPAVCGGLCWGAPPMVATSIRQLSLIQHHQAAMRACTRCPDVFGPVVVGEPVASKVFLLGQAPGRREPELGRPFAWTAGKQLFKWFSALGLEEAQFRERIYMAAVCRCFPGKALNGGGDRVPAPHEVLNCRPWLEAELALLEPELLILVGRLAIEQFLAPRPLVEQVGRLHRVGWKGRDLDVIPLPHPSGASTWPRMEPGKTLTLRALALIAEHAAFQNLLAPHKRISPAGHSRPASHSRGIR